METMILSFFRAVLIGMMIFGCTGLTAGIQESGAAETAQERPASQDTSEKVNINSADSAIDQHFRPRRRQCHL